MGRRRTGARVNVRFTGLNVVERPARESRGAGDGRRLGHPSPRSAGSDPAPTIQEVVVGAFRVSLLMIRRGDGCGLDDPLRYAFSRSVLERRLAEVVWDLD